MKVQPLDTLAAAKVREMVRLDTVAEAGDDAK
jgi:hypothetical protein